MARILFPRDSFQQGTLFFLTRYERHLGVTQESEVDKMSDDEIDARINFDVLKTLSEEFGVQLDDAGICRITSDAVVKTEMNFFDNKISSEALTLDFVARHTTIPVPRVRRVLPLEYGHVAIVMDYIPGRQLRHVWPTMSLFAKIRVAFILRGYIRQLRAIRHPRSLIPGPLAPGDEARPTLCQIMTGQMEVSRPACPTYADLSAWHNKRYAMSVEGIPSFHVGIPPEPFDDSEPLVLTHCDLNMRNILVGDDGKLYLIDWAFSGFYPPWFEFVNWRYWLQEKFGGKATDFERNDWLWNLLIPFMTLGPYFRQEKWFYRGISPVLIYLN